MTAEDGSRLYHAGSRELQDRFDTRRIADRLEGATLRSAFNDADRELIDHAPFFFLATTDPSGFPDVSYKGGLPGFVRVVGQSTLAFPNYDGNGMYRSLGNVLADPRVSLLFLSFSKPARRLRVQGRASLHHDDPLLGGLPGAQFVVRVEAGRIFPNCPRYLHSMTIDSYSVYAPRPEHEPPVPAWKRRPEYRDALPARDRLELDRIRRS